MRPPAISTLCMDILPVLCKRKKNRERRGGEERRGGGGGEMRTGQTRIIDFYNKIHSRHCFGLVANSAIERKVKSSLPRCSAAVEAKSYKS